MLFMQIICFLFSLWTLFLCRDEYKKGSMSQRNYKIVFFCETVVAAGILFLILMQLIR